jgi:flagellar hook-associated protein 2
MEILSSSYINELITNYKSVEVNRRLQPIETRRQTFSTLSSTLTTVSSKLTSLLTSFSTLKSTSTSSIFNTKSASSSNETLVTATADKTASVGSYEIFVQQLAKRDMLISQDLSSSAVSGLSGTHYFTINTGDGANPDFNSTIKVELDGTETNSEMLQKISDAINGDKAEINSTAKAGTDIYSGGISTIKFNVGGEEYSISVNGGGTYEELIDEIILQIDANVQGVFAEKVIDDPAVGDVKLKITTNNSDDYISISHESGFDLVTDLGIETNKEIAAHSVVSVSNFNPASDRSQFSITTKNSGLDYRIKNIFDESGSNVLAQLGLNLGTSRPAFDQTGDPDTPGFVYADITEANNELNSRFTFNNVQIQNNSNIIDDLVSGVQFNLKSVMNVEEPNVSITIENDTETIKNEITAFINKFNDLYSFLKDKTKSTEESTVSSLLNSLSSVGYTSFGEESDEFNYLSQIGISFDPQSGLSLKDPDLFEEKINSDSDAVEKLFNSENGFATTFYDKLNAYTGADGYLQLSIESYNNSTRYLSDRIDSVSKSIDKSADVLRKKYQQMQTQLATLLSNQSFFSTSDY